MTAMTQKNQGVGGWTLLAFCSFVLVLPVVMSSDPVVTLQPPAMAIPPGDFGLHFHRLASTTRWPQSIQVGSWRLLAAYVDWPDLEPSRDKWDLKNLDLYLSLAEQYHVEVMLPLVRTPQWASARPDEKSSYALGNAAEPKDMADWQNYVRTIATRYKGRIHEYEIWNEPNLKEFYTGSIQQMVEMARIAYTTLKEIDPTILVCSPSATNQYGVQWLEQYLKAGGAKYADVIGYHFYVNPAPPEEIVPMIDEVEAVMQRDGAAGKPLWDTETGWAIQNADGSVRPAPGKGFNSIVLSPERASAYLTRAYILSWASGVSRLYWYAWDDWITGLTEKDGRTLKSPAHAYAELENWLIGAHMTSCSSDSVGTWICEITRDGGYHGWILWNPNQTFDYDVPAAWSARIVHDLAGQLEPLSDGKVQIGPTPVLLEKPPR
jgi:hypothetical protein